MGKRRSGQKLCVVSSCNTDTDDIYKIFIVDIGGGGGGEVYLETEPNIRIQALDGYRRMSFCFLDSVLYVFDNFNKFDLSESRYKKKSVYKYAFDPDEVCEKKNFLLELSALGVFSRMLTPKVDGRAIPIPDGRILVHSCEIDIPIKDGMIFEDDNEEVLKHFEIFDPKTGLSVELQAPELRVGYLDLELRTDDKGWISLPRDEPQPLMGKYEEEIAVSAVVNSILICKSTLVLSVQVKQLSPVHFLTIDIESPTARGWQPYHGWLLPRAHVQHFDPDPGPSLVVEDRVCFTCRLGYGNGNGNGNGNEVEHPLSDITSIPFHLLGAPSCIALVDYLPNQECWFAVVRTRFTRRMGEYLAIDVFKGELPSRKKNKNKPTPRVHRIKSFKFHIPVGDGCFCVRNAFMLCPTIFPFPLL